ncbi:hypothetical protein [Finegoldia magna]|uniref:hypothetical protein n=1 Tax=Finegoldia magna TaxID=1260 RepID=UPI0002DD53E0|nr:hypothetical protein [Finegoldia magna]UEA69863.1 hypothetical protein LK415_06610 [Finegoldia magna]
MLTQEMNITFKEGNLIGRTLPNGITDQFEITQVNYSSDFMNMAIKNVINNSSLVSAC